MMKSKKHPSIDILVWKLFSLLILSSCLGFLACTTPTNPANDPENVALTITNVTSKIQHAGDTLQLNVLVNYPKLVDFIQVKYNTGYDSLFKKPLPEILVVKSIIKVAGEDTVRISAQLTNAKTKDTIFTFYALPRDTSVQSPVDVTAPALRFLYPSDSLTTNVNAKKIEFVAQDSAGISAVRVAIGTDTLPTTKTNDTLYYATVSNLQSNAYTKIDISAWDASVAKNKTSKSIYIKYDPIATDITGPAITLTDSTKDSMVTATNSRIIRFSVKDTSKISRVKIELGTDTFAVVRTNDTLYSATVSNLQKGVYNSVVVSAWDSSLSKNKTIKTVYIKYDPTLLDTFGPSIRFINPIKDSSTIGANYLKLQLSVKDSSKVAQVKVTLGADTFDVIQVNDSIFNSTITGLQNGIYNKITVVALDSSASKNRTTSMIFVKSDASLPDSTGPSIVWQSGPRQASYPVRVLDSTGTLVYDITDQTGIDSVYFLLNGNLAGSPTVNGNRYTFNFNLGKSFKLDTIKIVALDKATRHNRSEEIILLNYNTKIGQITLQAPTSNQTNVTKLPLFKWNGGTDPDGDSVIAKVYYGTQKDSLNTSLKVTTANQFQITTALPLNTKILWKVKTLSTTFPEDSIESTTDSFSTAGANIKIALLSPIHGITRINPATDTLKFTIDSLSGAKTGYTIIIDTLKSLNTTQNRKTQSSFNSPLRTFPVIKNSRKYYWTIIVTDTGTAGIKRDTAATDSFYTLNTPPSWSALPTAHDTTYYKIALDLSKFCSDPDGTPLSYSVNGTGCSISGSILNYPADSQMVTITARDNFSAQPCSAKITIQGYWFRNKLMKLIPSAGKTFQMGQVGVENAEPVHPISFTYNFWMDSTEVTLADYEALVKQNPSYYTGSQKPITNVNWFDAIYYCNARSKRDGFDTIYNYSNILGTPGNNGLIANVKPDYSKNGYRLPSNAEAEFACRANSITLFYWGDQSDISMLAQYCWYAGNTSQEPQQVAQKKENAFGLYDMTGNVTEWMTDHFYTYNSSQTTDFFGPDTGTSGIVRGGSWAAGVVIPTLTSAGRFNIETSNIYGDLGFRVVRKKTN